MKRSKISHKLAAALTVGALATTSADAFAAAADFTKVTDNIATASGGLPAMVSMVGYVGGSALSVAGIFKLKQHVDNPGQVALKDGLARLGCGGALLSLPFITAAMQGSISDGDATQANQDILEGTDVFAVGG